VKIPTQEVLDKIEAALCSWGECTIQQKEKVLELLKEGSRKKSIWRQLFIGMVDDEEASGESG